MEILHHGITDITFGVIHVQVQINVSKSASKSALTFASVCKVHVEV